MPTFAREAVRLSRANKVYYTLGALFFLSTILVYTYPSIQAVQLVYIEQKIKANERELMAENNRLNLEYEMLISPDEMEIRSLQAGFVEPKTGQVIFVKKNR